jgi:hypothetical protein
VIATHNLLTLCCGFSSLPFHDVVQFSSTDWTAMPTRPLKLRPS